MGRNLDPSYFKRAMMPDATSKPSALDTPESLIAEVMVINKAVQKYPEPTQPAQRPTSKELIERQGLSDVVAASLAVSGILLASLSMIVGGFIFGWSSTAPAPLGAALVMLTVGGCVSGFAVQTKAFGKFWTRVVRKKHYLMIHEKQKSEQEIEMQAYSQALAKREKVMKRMRKRAKPVIEAYNAKDPLKKLGFSEEQGLVAIERKRYTPEQQFALDIASSVFTEDRTELLQSLQQDTKSLSTGQKSR